jgi:hypothetical protein
MKKQDSRILKLSRWTALALGAWAVLAPWRTEAVGTWVALANNAPGPVALMLLLSDGTVMAQGSGANVWYRLTPDSHGSYVNGSWTTIQAMNDSRTFYSSDVLRDGRVLVAGGEYGTGGAKAEVYDPVANSWTATPVAGVGFSDSQSRILPNGNVLAAPVSWVPYPQWVTFLYNPYANSWSQGPTNLEYQDEASWVKLPDDSILTLDPYGYYSSERYIPSLNQWIVDAIPPEQLFSSGNNEIGPAFLLANGKAFFLGGTGGTLLYTPTGNNNPGTWTIGPNIPNGRAAQDAPGAMMVNGKILFEVSSPTNHTPVYFDEYDPVANAFTQTGSPGNPAAGSSFNAGSDNTYMLDLPDGTVLYSYYNGSLLYVYQPDGTPQAAGKPTIYNISWNTDGSLHLTGTLLNGISEGAAYGDDAQMDSNYPLVRLTDGSGNVSYARTYNWSSTSVMTGGRVVTTEFTLPSNLSTFAARYSLVVVANGIASDPVTFYGPVWVDFNYSGFQFGTYTFPYSTLSQGVSAVASGGTIAIKPGASHETMTISKPMTITAIGGAATIGH